MDGYFTYARTRLARALIRYIWMVTSPMHGQGSLITDLWIASFRDKKKSEIFFKVKVPHSDVELI